DSRCEALRILGGRGRRDRRLRGRTIGGDEKIAGGPQPALSSEAEIASCRARLIRQLLEDYAQHGGGAHAPRGRQSQRDAVELKLESLGIAADAAPGPVRGPQELGRI